MLPNKETSPTGLSLFETVSTDYLGFGIGSQFKAKEVQSFLELKREDVAHLAAVSSKSVSFDNAMPEQVRQRLEEIAITINMVAQVFEGDVDKTVTWFKVRNPLLGDVSPRDMIRLGRFDKLRKFILNALIQSRSTTAPLPLRAH